MKLLSIFLLSVFLLSIVSATTVTVSHGANMGGEEGNGLTVKRGMNITTINNVNITHLYKPTFTNATMCYLYDTDTNLMSNASFVGNVCNLSGNITTVAGRQYQILMDRLGATYSINGSLSVLPINSEGLTWNQGCYNGCGSQNGQVFGFTNLTYLILNESSYNNNQILALCNATYTNKVLNLTFKDETVLSFINATIPSSTFVYWLSSPSINKTLTFSNTTANLNYTFCSSINDGSPQYISPNVQYTSSGYPQRTWNPLTITYTNSTINQILTLLSSGDGIYVTFQVVNNQDQLLSGVLITAIRNMGGVDVIVSTGTTDATGTFTTFLNPDFAHDFSFSKSGFTTYNTTFTPTQTSYTITLGGGGSGATSDYTIGMKPYTSPIQEELFNDTTYTFEFNLTSSYWSVTSFGYNLRLANGSIVSTASSTTAGTPATSNYNVNNQTIIYMDYYWIVEGNSTTGTKYWIVSNTDNTGFSVMNFFTDLNLYINSGIFGLDNFGRYLIIFLVMFITIGIMSYKYGLTSPMAITTMIFLVVFFFDVVVGLIPQIRGIDNLLTYLAGLILAVVVLREVTT